MKALSSHTPPPTRRQFLASTAALALTSPALLAAEKPKTVQDGLAGAMSEARLDMLFKGSTKAEFAAWRTAFRAKLNELLGDSSPPESWTAEVEEEARFPDHTRLSLLLQAKGVPSLPVHLLLPAKLAQGTKAPGVLCVHGHGPFGHDAVAGRRDIEGIEEAIRHANYDYGLQFARRGYVAAAPCMIPFGRRVNAKAYGGKDPCAVTFVRLQALGRLSLTENLRDLRWTLSLLQSRPEVLRDRLGCAGLSYGGRMTMMTAAIDERVKVACVSGALNLMQERMRGRYSCGSQVIPGLLNHGDYSEIGSLIAPRPCVWETGSTDSLIVPKWSDIFRDRLRRAYAAAGASKNLHFDRFEGGHRWNGEVAFPLFDQVLRG